MLDDFDLAELLEVFRPEAEEYLATLRGGADANEAARLLHSLKGAAGTVGLMEVSTFAARLEEKARAGTVPREEDLVRIEQMISGEGAEPSPASQPEPAAAEAVEDAVDLTPSDELAAELLDIFTEEAEETLERIGDALLRLEEDPEDLQPLDAILRQTHTIKGAASMAGLPEIGTVAHRLEDAFAAVKAKGKPPGEDVLDLLQTEVDALGAMVERAAAGEPIELPDTPDGPLSEIALSDLDDEQQVVASQPAASSTPVGLPRRTAGIPGRLAASMGMKVPPRPTMTPAQAALLAQETEAEPPEVDDSITVERRRTERRLEREVVRVDLVQIDGMQGSLGELVIGRNRDDLHVSDLKALSSDLISARRKLLEQIDFLRRAVAGGSAELALMTAEELTYELEEHRRRLVEFDTRLNGSLAQLERLIATMLDDGDVRRRVLREMESQLTDIRMVSIAALTARLRRPAREAARRFRKRVRLVVTGRDVGLDKSVVDQIADPLLHLVRNAVVHGIETPEERIRRGKDPTGVVTIAAERRRGNIVIEVRDDGGGVDPGRVRAAVIRAGLMTTARAGGLDAGQITEAIFQSGVSTMHTVGDIAGRGVGLDLVRTRVEAVGGSVELHTKLAEGTRFVLRLPQTLMILPALMVQVAGQQFAVPLNAVRAVTRITPDQILTRAREGERIEFRRERIQLVRLERILGLRRTEPTGARLAVILEGESGTYAMPVDSLMRREEIVAKSLGDLLSGLRAFAGATMTGDGKVCLILDAAALPKQRAVKPVKSRAERRTPLILIVDDSSSIREAVKRIVASAGYRVQTAGDGGEAWELLRNGEVDLVMTDLEMPGMTGYDLLDRIRRSQRHRGLPVIVLSGLSSEENQRLAREKGALEYLVKPVHRKIVLENVERILRKQGMKKALVGGG